VTDKTVAVQLVADVGRFRAGMSEATRITQQFGRDVDQHLAGMSGQRMQQLGSSLSRNVTLPLAAAGTAAAAMAVQFDTSFRQMQGLAGVTAGEVDGLRESVLGLAGETAQSPQALAEALYFVRSAGIEGAAAMETLEVAAQGATIGLGDAATIADVVTSALGAYGQANLTAAEAGDVLVATAREGKAEAAALAPQFGRLLPIASELGVSFDEVGGALAYLSRSGGGAELAATNLGNVLQKLLTPAEEGVRALEAMGMSTDTLRQSIARDGLLDTLVMLRSSLEANGMELGDFSRDAQFTTGVLALTADEGERAREVFDATANSAGAFAEAFGIAARGPGFEMKQALAELQVAAIRFGDTIVPVAAAVAGALGDVAGVVGSLPGPVRTAVVALGGIAAMAGPTLKLVGHFRELSTKLEAIGSEGGRAAGVLRGIGSAAGAAGTLLAGFTAAAVIWEARLESGRAEADRMADSVAASFRGLDFQQTIRQLDRLRDGIDDLSRTRSINPLDADFNEDMRAAEDALAAVYTQQQRVVDATRAYAITVGVSNEEAHDAIVNSEQLADIISGELSPSVGAGEAAIARYSDAVDDANGRLEETRSAAQEAADALIGSFSSALQSEELALRRAGILEGLEATWQSYERGEASLADYQLAVNDATDAMLLEAQAAVDAATDQATLEGRTLDATTQMGIFRGKIDEIASTLAPGSPVRVNLENYSGQLAATEGTYTALIVADTAAATEAAANFEALLARIQNTPWRATFTWSMNGPNPNVEKPWQSIFGLPDGGASGGYVGQTTRGPSDTVHMMVDPNEFILSAGSVDALERAGVDLDRLNAYRSGPVAPLLDPRQLVPTCAGEMVICSR
jgi:TP901 family phage tail tape measure protein